MSSSKVVVIILLMTMMVSREAEGVSMNYYMIDGGCPMAEMTVREAVQEAVERDPSVAAALLRLHFHDCFVEGCDASILIDSTDDNTAEKDSPANLGLRGYEVIDHAKDSLERDCPGVVSCADILAMAARDAVFFAGGPFYDIPMGRKDGTRSKIEDTASLPPPFFNATQLIAIFARHGFTPRDTVALSGAHTLGSASCAFFKDRLQNHDDNNDFLASLSRTCAADDRNRQPFDPTRNDFDNAYFNALLRGNGLLTSDHALYASPITRPTVAAYARNQAMFFFDFQQAMRKMSLLSLKDESRGQVRSNCHAIN